MRVGRIIRSLIAPCTEMVHKKTVDAVERFCLALVAGQTLGVTALGRAASGSRYAKHRIKASDRLVGNARLHGSIPIFYRALAWHWLRLARRDAVILVDWTGLKNGVHCLSASVAFQGRSIPVYAEAHRQKKLSNRRIEARFLKHLKEILPPRCRPVIVTDAGFYTEWCDAVQELQWDFVARVRNKTMYRFSREIWSPVKKLHAAATHKARSLGWLWLTKTKPRKRRLIAINKRPRTNRASSRGRSTTAKKHRRQAREPWILATNLALTPRKIVSIYAQRMQIEQNYRDFKDTRWGWALEQSRTQSAERFAVLILLATIATLAVLLIGLVAERNDLHLHHQANTIRKRRVLSLFFIGNRILLESQPFNLGSLQRAMFLLADSCFAPNT